MLGLVWDPVSDYISMYLAVNLSHKKANVRRGPKITLDDLSQLSEIPLTKRIRISQINTIYDPLGLLAPLTIHLNLTLQKMTSLSLGWDKVLQGEINHDLRRILTEMVVSPDIKFPRAVVPVDVEAEFELLGETIVERQAGVYVIQAAIGDYPELGGSGARLQGPVM